MKVDIRSVQKAESAVSTDEFPANVITQANYSTELWKEKFSARVGTARQDIYPLFSVMGLREDLFISLSCFHLSGLRKKAWKCCIETGIQQITGLKIYTTEPVWKTFLMCTGKEANGKNCRSMTFKQFDSDSAAELKELSLQQCMT